jgi:hypothetical protein
MQKKSLREGGKQLEQSCVIQAITYHSDHQQQILLLVSSVNVAKDNA